jgi:hypothetical protein
VPKNIAQWIGILVTSIIVLGADRDVLAAVPYGLLAGALATFFVALGVGRQPAPLLLRRLRRD